MSGKDFVHLLKIGDPIVTSRVRDEARVDPSMLLAYVHDAGEMQCPVGSSSHDYLSHYDAVVIIKCPSWPQW